MEKVVLFFPSQDIQFNWPPFSYMVLAPILKRAGFNPIVIDQRVQTNWKELLDENLDALWIGMSVMIGPAITNSLKVIEYIKSKSDIPIVYGGWWPTSAQRLTLEHPLVDYILIGAGDEAVISISRYFQGKGEKPDVLLTKKEIDKADSSTTLREPIVPSKKSDWKMAYELIPNLELYRSKNNVMATFAAMSCPYGKCKFCCIVQHYRYVMRDCENILDEIDFLINKKKFSSIIFLDGLFLTGQKTIELLRGFKRRKFKMEWKCKLRTDSLPNLTKEEILLLKDTGLKVISCGFESGSDRMLKLINKGVKAEDTCETARICKEYDFELQGNFLFGLPGENVDDLNKTIEHIEKLNKITDKFFYNNYFYVPTPGSQSFNEFVETGGKVPDSLGGWANLLWQDVPGKSDINKLHWLSPKERREYIKTYNDYFNKTKAKQRISWRHTKEHQKDKYRKALPDYTLKTNGG